MSTSFCFDTVFHAVWRPTKVFCFTLCWLMASKLLETVVWAPVFVQASNVASFSTWRPAPDIISPVGRDAATQQPGECDGGIYLSAPFWQIQAEREFIISAWLVPLPLMNYLPWCTLPNVGKICIPKKCLNIDDTKHICSFPKAKFSQQIKLMAQKLQTSFSVCYFAAPSSVLLNLYTLLKGTFLPCNCPASLLGSVSRLHLVIQPCDMIYILTVTSRPNNQPRQDTSETDDTLPAVLHSGFFHPFPLLIFIYFWLDFIFLYVVLWFTCLYTQERIKLLAGVRMFNSITAAGTTPPSASC